MVRAASQRLPVLVQRAWRVAHVVPEETAIAVDQPPGPIRRPGGSCARREALKRRLVRRPPGEKAKSMVQYHTHTKALK